MRGDDHLGVRLNPGFLDHDKVNAQLEKFLQKEDPREMSNVLSSDKQVFDMILFGSGAKGDFSPDSVINLALKGQKIEKRGFEKCYRNKLYFPVKLI